MLLMAQEVGGAAGAADYRSHCCTDQDPGREEVVGEAAGYNPDFHIRRRG